MRSPEEFAQCEANVQDFLANEGPRLQLYLWLKWCFSTNYISNWWETYVYLRSRGSIMIDSNYYCIDAPLGDSPTSNREARAAVVLYELLVFLTASFT
jgi:hypothetical protein